MGERRHTGGDAPPPSLGSCGGEEAMLFGVVQRLQVAYRILRVPFISKGFLCFRQLRSSVCS
jgi:hypothetical protein